jgi:hypothetical protein
MKSKVLFFVAALLASHQVFAMGMGRKVDSEEFTKAVINAEETAYQKQVLDSDDVEIGDDCVLSVADDFKGTIVCSLVKDTRKGFLIIDAKIMNPDDPNRYEAISGKVSDIILPDPN